jgi:hypothetical protein
MIITRKFGTVKVAFLVFREYVTDYCYYIFLFGETYYFKDPKIVNCCQVYNV